MQTHNHTKSINGDTSNRSSFHVCKYKPTGYAVAVCSLGFWSGDYFSASADAISLKGFEGLLLQRKCLNKICILLL